MFVFNSEAHAEPLAMQITRAGFDASPEVVGEWQAVIDGIDRLEVLGMVKESEAVRVREAVSRFVATRIWRKAA